jgi:hypothetical protein
LPLARRHGFDVLIVLLTIEAMFEVAFRRGAPDVSVMVLQVGAVRHKLPDTSSSRRRPGSPTTDRTAFRG